MMDKHIEISENLNALSGGEKSKWAEDARWRRDNNSWLSESFSVALQVMDALDALGWNQKRLAKESGVSPQRISKIITGKENLTLKTIKALDKALNIKINTNTEMFKEYEQKIHSLSKKIDGKQSEINCLKNEIIELRKEINRNKEHGLAATAA
jgi:transcriptional regulator with XRE-family HTH domain